MNDKTIVIALSGGKDSTAMLLTMLENNERIDYILFLDTGWEFPQMLEHINKLEKYINKKIWRLYPQLPFEYVLYKKPMRKKGGVNKGKVMRYGKGWPRPRIRWCTGEKVYTLTHFYKTLINPVINVGYAYDENHRTLFTTKGIPQRYPLQEYKITEREALKICYRVGFDWGGLYDYLNRVSCFCCPLQSERNLFQIRKEHTRLWEKALEWDKKQPSPYFKNGHSLQWYDSYFSKIERKKGLFNR